MTRSSAGRTRSSSDRHHGPVHPVGGKVVGRPDAAEVGKDGVAPHPSGRVDDAGGDGFEVGEVVVVPERLGDDQLGHRCRLELTVQLRWLEQGAQRHQHRPDAHDRSGDDGPLDPVLHQESDPRGHCHSRGHQPPGQSRAACRQLGVADRAQLADDRRLVAVDRGVVRGGGRGG